MLVQYINVFILTGWLVNIKSIRELYDYIVKNEKMNYICTFKLSQDPLENFFSSVRMLLGCGNNPTTTQFKAAFVPPPPPRVSADLGCGSGFAIIFPPGSVFNMQIRIQEGKFAGKNWKNTRKFFTNFVKLDPDPHLKAAGSGSALRRTAGSGSAKNECRSTALVHT